MRKSLLSPASNKLSRPDAGIFIWDLFGLDGEEEVGKKIGVEDNCYGKKVKIVLFYKKIHIYFTFMIFKESPQGFEFMYKQHNWHSYKVALEITNSISPERVSLIRKKWLFCSHFCYSV